MQQSFPSDARWQAAQREFQAGNFSAARTEAALVVALTPEHSGAHLLLSNLASNEDQHRLATAHALQAAQRMGRQSLQHVAAVVLKLISLGEYEAATRLVRKVDPARVPAPGSLAEFAQQLSLLEQHEDALRYLEAALRLGLDGDWVHYLHGNFLKFLGRMDESVAAYERSLVLNPDQAFSHYAIATTAGREGAGQRVDRLRRCLDRVGSGFRDLAYLEYALFRELDALGDTAPAWDALQAGFTAKRRKVDYNPFEESAIFDAVIAKTGPGFADAAVDAAN